MIEGLKTIEHEKVNMVDPSATKSAKMTDMIRFYNDQMDSVIDRLYVSARVLVGENMSDKREKFDSPACLMDDVWLLGEKLKKITELSDIIGGCL